MTTLTERIQADLKEAMRAQDKKKVSTLRLLTAAIKQIEVDERVVVDDARLLQILDKFVKQRHESIEQFKKASRDDLVAQESYELEVVSIYLPEPLSASEITQLIQEAVTAQNATSMADMGKVMAALKPKLQGRCDMGQVSAQIKSILQSL